MTQADSVHSTPPTNTSAETLPERPAESAGELYYPTPVTPEEAFQAIGRLRKDARDEIDRLIRFLDRTDDYVSRELEDQVDDNPCDDRELEPSLCGVEAGAGREEDLEADGSDDEPSIGSGAVGEHSTQTEWAVRGVGCVDAEDEHDGAEPEDEGGEAEKEDYEPSLGWTVDGCITNTPQAACDLEEGTGARPPQDRTVVASNVGEEPGYPNRRRRGFAVKRTDRPSNGRGLL